LVQVENRLGLDALDDILTILDTKIAYVCCELY
jgi:2-keto-3-deoxy-L-rhamnonate aldolase RhmA